MKARTVVWISALGMALASAIGWGLSDSDAHEPPIAVGRPEFIPPIQSELHARAAGLDLEARLGHPVLAADGASETYLYASVSADSDHTGRTRAPLDVAIVVDRSGSMRGKRLDNALSAARGVLGRLTSNDIVSVIAYNGSASVLVPPTPLDDSARERMGRALSELQAQGSTCISCAIDTAVDALRGHSTSVSRIVLLSDGEATDGILDETGFRRVGEGARRAGIAITTIGVDIDYNERIMSALAEESNGHHYFVADASGLPSVFDQEFEALTRSVADSATLEIDLAPGVERLEVLDRAYEQADHHVRIPLGAFAAGERKSVLVRVRVEGRDAGRGEIASVGLAFRDLDGGDVRRVDGTLSGLFTHDHERLSELDPFVAERLTRSETAKTLTEANRLFAAGDADGAQKTIAASLGTMAERQKVAAKAVSKARASELATGFSTQQSVLQAAAKGFSSAPAGAAPQSREGRTQVRRNQAAAFDVSR